MLGSHPDSVNGKTMQLNLPLLARAIDRLDEGWQRYQQDISDTQIRDGLIQRFEFTYELCLKTLRRYFAQTADSWERIQTMSFDTFVRHAWDEGLLHEEIRQWRMFREKRNITSHTYHEEKAIEVCAAIPAFLAEAKYLYAAITKRQADEPED